MAKVGFRRRIYHALSRLTVAVVCALAFGMLVGQGVRDVTFTQVDYTKNVTFHSITTALAPPTGGDITGNQSNGIPFDIASTGNQTWRSELAAP